LLGVPAERGDTRICVRLACETLVNWVCEPLSGRDLPEDRR